MKKYGYLEMVDKGELPCEPYTDVFGVTFNTMPTMNLIFKEIDDDLNCSICNKKLTEHKAISEGSEIYQLCLNGTLCA